MATRRMFSKEIVRSDAFLDMPVSSQLLYFQLGMEADDDGFVDNAKTIARMTSTSSDDLKILFSKRFLLSFDNGLLVIKHWKINNYIPSDRYKETKYLEEKNGLVTKDNRSYTECIQPVYKVDTQNRIEEPRVDKIRLGKNNTEQSSEDIQEIIESFKEVNPSYKVLFPRPPQRKAVARLLKEHGKEKLLAIIAFLPKSNASKYAPKITTPIQLEDNLGKLIAWGQSQKSNTKGKQIIGLD